SRDSSRLSVLTEAVERQDWDYLTMHQYYCLFTVDSQSLSQNILHHPNLNGAFELMRYVLEPNERLSQEVLYLFANFPFPITRIAMNWPRIHHQQEQKFVQFMGLSVNFQSLMTACMRRKYPPLVRELYHGVGITSLIFQRIVFTAILRCVWKSSQHLEKEALTILHKNIEHFYRMNHPISLPSNLEDDDQHWSGLLCDLWRRSLSQPHPNNIPTHVSDLHALQPQTAQAAARRRGQPRIHDPAQPHRLLQIQPTQPNLQGATRSFFPDRTYVQPQQRDPNPTQFGLHQANLRSPVLKAQSAGPPLYQFVTGFAKHPARFKDAGRKIETWSLPLKNLNTIPKDIIRNVGEPATRTVNKNSNMLRLRCVKWPSSEPEPPDEHAWAIADTYWAPNTYFTFNDTLLHPRKKLYYGKDLPIDISALVKEGDNTLEIAVLREADDKRYLEYALAIEVIGFQSHDIIKQHCLTVNHIPATQTLDEIKSKLSATSLDDEISIVANNLTINLFDAFSASRICDIPARTKTCRHFDCFDLDTFLQTRPKKGDASIVDHWRCPICREDARPQHLIVDGFLEEVRRKIDEDGLFQTRAIIFNQDGSWKPRIE
ncbi:hypothetical protein K505DRAFT_226130, partial [Melanomma pulvis-pyrius CBS 109.77]